MIRPTSSLLRSLPLLPCAVLAANATGQCGHAWKEGYGCPGLNGVVHAMVRIDPDGAGPLPVHVVFGGQFSHAAAIPATNVAAWEPSSGQWLALPAPPLGAVSALAVSPVGELFAAVQTLPFVTPQAARIVRWNGAGWTQLGPDFDGPVRALHVRATGELVGGGSFAPLGGGPSLGGLAAWNGAAWTALGGGIPGEVHALASLPGGDLLAGGAFATAGGVPAAGIARWNGATWSPLGAGSPGLVGALHVVGANRVFAGDTQDGLIEWNGATWTPVPGIALSPIPRVAGLGSLPGRLVVAGTITAAGSSGATGIAALDLATGAWSALGAGFAPFALASARIPMLELGTGDLLVGTPVATVGGLEVAGVGRWDGASWHALYDAPLRVNCCAAIDDVAFVAGGRFTNIGDVAARRVAMWDGSQWRALGAGFDDAVRDVEVLANGDIVAGGGFTASGTVTTRAIARWNGTSWKELGGGVRGSVGVADTVAHLIELANGDLVVAGAFASAGSVPASNIAAWRNGAWVALGTGLPGFVRHVAAKGPNGLVAIVGADVWEWNGLAWLPFASYPPNEFPSALGALGDGSVVVSVEQPLGGWQFATFVDVHPPGGFATRQALGLGVALRWFHALPDGSLLTSGFRVSAAGLVAPFAIGAVGHTSTQPDGDLLVVTTPVPGTSVVTIGRFGPTCAATASAGGAGCAGSGGANVLAANELPWVGGVYSARATGMPAVGIAIGVRGLAAGSAPLALLLPSAPGCQLLVALDVLDALLPVNGVVTTRLPIPSLPALVGAVFHEQVVALDLAGGGVVASSTNRLDLTVGIW